MKYYVIAGEASGDLHASNLMKELKNIDNSAVFRFWGGDLMAEVAGKPVKHYRELAFMGFIEVAKNIRTIISNINFCKKDILKYNPDAVILVDYPGFNLRIAEFANKAGFKVFYYISPQVWAWKKSRISKIKKYVDRMFVILPFEKEFYAGYNFNVDFVGHPLLDITEDIDTKSHNDFINENNLPDKPVIALLPGSRRQEISKMLPVMLSITGQFPGYQFIIAGAPSIDKDFYKQFITNDSVEIIYNKTYPLLKNSNAAIVTSGTATLETALFEVPEVVCYKGNPLSFFIAKQVVDKKIIKYISLVNLIMDKEIVKELIQSDLTKENLIYELTKITDDINTRNKIIKDYKELKSRLGGPGASKKTAKLILNHINS